VLALIPTGGGKSLTF
jgi:superfamily II DNA helicase RecQ